MKPDPIRNQRADLDPDRLNVEIAAAIKGMLARGDKQSDIAACFLTNGGRISEINTGTRFSEVEAARPDQLPPAGPYIRHRMSFGRPARKPGACASPSKRQSVPYTKAMIAIHKVER